MLEELLGASLVLLALYDILVTILHPYVQGTISARYYRLVWRTVRGLSLLLPIHQRRTLLSWILPLAVATLLLLWTLLLIVGFALIYLPQIGRTPSFSPIGVHAGFVEAVYFSGQCLTSIGFGDMVPRTDDLRLVSVGEGICGLLVVGVAAAYILTVFPSLSMLNGLAVTLNEETDGRPDAVPMVQRYLSAGALEALAQRCRELSIQLMVLGESHTAHPVLFYAHPRRVERSFPRILLVAQQLVALLRYGLRPSDYPQLVQDPRVVGLEESLISTLRELGSSLHLTVQPPHGGVDDRDDLRKDFYMLVASLRAAGLRNAEPPLRIERRSYVRYRLVTDAFIEAYGANSGYARVDLWGAYPPLRGLTAPLPHESDDDSTADETMQ